MVRSTPSAPENERGPNARQGYNNPAADSGPAPAQTPEDSRDTKQVEVFEDPNHGTLNTSDSAENEYEVGRAYFRFPHTDLGEGKVSLQFRGHELSLNGSGLGLPLMLVGFGPVAMVLVGGTLGLPIWAILIMSLATLVALAGLMVLLVMLGRSN